MLKGAFRSPLTNPSSRREFDYGPPDPSLFFVRTLPLKGAFRSPSTNRHEWNYTTRVCGFLGGSRKTNSSMKTNSRTKANQSASTTVWLLFLRSCDGLLRFPFPFFSCRFSVFLRSSVHLFSCRFSVFLRSCRSGPVFLLPPRPISSFRLWCLCSGRYPSHPHGVQRFEHEPALQPATRHLADREPWHSPGVKQEWHLQSGQPTWATTECYRTCKQMAGRSLM